MSDRLILLGILLVVDILALSLNAQLNNSLRARIVTFRSKAREDLATDRSPMDRGVQVDP